MCSLALTQQVGGHVVFSVQVVKKKSSEKKHSGKKAKKKSGNGKASFGRPQKKAEGKREERAKKAKKDKKPGSKRKACSEADEPAQAGGLEWLRSFCNGLASGAGGLAWRI